MITTYICQPDTRAALEWYTARLGARPLGEPWVDDDGRIGHAEMEVFGARVMMSDEYASADVAPPLPDRGAAVTLVAHADDLDALARQVTDGGGRVTRGPEEGGPTGRILVFRDPFGHRWMVLA